ncbi:MAG TPA: alpha/beta hydrolase [Candidatus Obscuribacterales bacterium]
MAHINTVKLGVHDNTIVILHGWGQSLEPLRALGDLLSRFYTVYLLDLPGFGLSPRPEQDWGTVDYAQCILKFLDDTGIKKTVLIGHSFGGRVGIRLASRYPDRLESLVLINSGGLRPIVKGKRLLRSRLLRLLSKFLKKIDQTFGSRCFESWFVPRYGSRDYKNAGELRNILVKTVNEDISMDASKVPVKTLLLWGDRDEETPVEMGYRLNRLIPNSKLIVLPGKDHFPFLEEGAHLCATHILRFLKESEKTAKGQKQGDLASV